jgi:hypothetical protein
MEEKFMVYENWTQRPKKAMVHKRSCGKIKDGGIRYTDKSLTSNPGINDRWYGEFTTLAVATAFASLLPNRDLMYCSFCLREEKQLL